MDIAEKLIAIALEKGAAHAQVVKVADIRFDREFRKMCEMNSCGLYGRNWMCPPDVGDIDTLIAQAHEYTYALVYQTISPLEDSFDIEGMLEAGEQMNKLAEAIDEAVAAMPFTAMLHLGGGGCSLCKRCAKRDDQPCRFPHRAKPSLEAYGVYVSELAKLAGMNYINGTNTVTYFGGVLYNL